LLTRKVSEQRNVWLHHAARYQQHGSAWQAPNRRI
jgi:hypothetical protein